MFSRSGFAAALLAVTSISAGSLATPASAAVDQSDPSRFIQTLSADAFSTIRSAGSNHATARAKFRSLLSQYFAIDQIGDKLIAPERAQITPAQYQAYKAALPSFLIGTYADRLFDYASADLKVVRSVPRGDSAAVLTQVTQPGQQPVTAIWTVERSGAGYRVTNLSVAGINLALTQQADFTSFVQRKGFDALVAFMKSRG